MKPTSLLLTLIVPSLAAATPSTLGEGDSYAWAGNFGWIELVPNRPDPLDGVFVTDTHLGGMGWSDSTGWIDLGDGAPADGIRYSNTDSSDFGVNHDGAGNLSGLAWSPNLGWINFGWVDPQNPNRPRFDLYHGGFLGCAWCPNAGWITLGTGLLKTDSMVVTDSDGDGISDTWEMGYAGGLAVLGAGQDSDGDGVSDVDEYAADTNPFDPGDFLRVLTVSRKPTGTELEWTSRQTRVYRVQESPDLNAWADSLLGVVLPDAGMSTTRLTPHAAAPRRFFRVESLVPLQP